MSILSSVKSAVSKVANTVKTAVTSTASKVTSAVSNAVSTASKKLRDDTPTTTKAVSVSSSSSSPSSSSQSSTKTNSASISTTPEKSKSLRSSSGSSSSSSSSSTPSFIELATQQTALPKEMAEQPIIYTTQSSDKSLRKENSSSATPQSNVIQTVINQASELANKVDENLFSGFLPGLANRTEVATKKLREDTEQKEELYDAKLEAQKTEIQYKLEKELAEASFKEDKQVIDYKKDIVSVDGLENIGLFKSAEEKAFQETLQKEAYFEQQAQQIPEVEQAYNEYATAKKENPNYDTALSVPLESSLTSSNLLKVGLGIAGGIALALLLTRRK